jgi:hypothetical protein
MAEYKVHIYAIVRVPVDNIEADSQEEAIEQADEAALRLLH